jgi:hypothetical protein
MAVNHMLETFPCNAEAQKGLVKTVKTAATERVKKHGGKVSNRTQP